MFRVDNMYAQFNHLKALRLFQAPQYALSNATMLLLLLMLISLSNIMHQYQPTKIMYEKNENVKVTMKKHKTQLLILETQATQKVYFPYKVVE